MFLASIFLAFFATLTLGAPSDSINNDSEPFHLYPENNGGRIVGGQVTSIEVIDYIGSLLRNGNHNCGVCIISEAYTLSAAHCVNNVAPASLAVRVGSSFRSSGGTVIGVMRSIVHPSYVPSTIDFDYAILMLSSKLTFGIGIQPISLPHPGEKIADDTYTWTSGWGNTLNPNESNEILRKVDIPIVNREKCRLAYASRNAVTERMICAGYYYDGGKDACQG